MGELPTDASGAFDGTVPVPAGLAPGDYTLQMNGYAADGAVRSLSIGVVVTPATAPAAAAPARQARATVYFAPASSALTDQAKATLAALARKAGKNTARTVTTGYVQPTTSTANDEELSTQRARSVAAYLRSIGVTGPSIAKGDGVAAQAGATARRAQVTITYRP